MDLSFLIVFKKNVCLIFANALPKPHNLILEPRHISPPQKIGLDFFLKHCGSRLASRLEFYGSEQNEDL